MSSLPDGVTLRALRHEDAAHVAELLAEYERGFGHEPSLGEQDVRAWWLRTNLDEDSWLLEEAGTAVAGGGSSDRRITPSPALPYGRGRGPRARGPGSSSTPRVTLARSG